MSVPLHWHVQFIPDFVKDAKKRVREIGSELERLVPMYTRGSQRRDIFHKVLSAIVGKLKEIVVMGNSTAVRATNGKPNLNVVPRVTAMYRDYADSINKVRE